MSFLACCIAAFALAGGQSDDRATLEASIDAYVAPLIDLQVFSGTILVTRHDTGLLIAALHFFDPPHGQLRWIRPGTVIDRDMATLLVRDLGSRYRVLNAPHDVDGQSGGVISITSLLRPSPDSATVTAVYTHHTRHSTGPATTVTIDLVRKEGKWTRLKQ